MWVRRTQYAIGQGGFHVESIPRDKKGNDYILVYDCGSKSKESVASEAIKRFLNEYDPKKIDAIFISHLDADHINALKFLKSVKIDDVYLPYLDVFNAVIHFLHFENITESSEELVELAKVLFTPKEYFRTFWDESEGGVENIIQIPPHGFRPSDEEQFMETIQNKEVDVKDIKKDGSYLRSGTSIKLHNWILRPYVSPLWIFGTYLTSSLRDRMREFEETLEEVLGENPEGAEIIDALEAKTESLEKMKEAYRKLLGKKDINLTSMSLYSGPPPKFSQEMDRFVIIGQKKACFTTTIGTAGFLGTGDAKLGSVNLKKKETRNEKKYRSEFHRTYKNIAPLVYTLNLPHHGSKNNSSEALIKPLKNLRVALANASTVNGHGHPHDEVRCYIKKARVHFIQVTEHKITDFEEVIVLPC